MENHHLNHTYSDENASENGYGIDFSFILDNLPTRERNALKTLAIVTVDAFCKYDFSQLFSVRGYGETTVTRLQEVQSRILAANGLGMKDEQLSLATPLAHLCLSTKEFKALHQLGVATVGDFLNIDLSNLQLPKGFGSTTHRLLAKSRKRLLRELSLDLSKTVTWSGQSVFSLPLNPREKSALIKSGVSNLKEFACFDFQHIGDIPNLGAGTMQSLLSKQAKVREKIILENINSASEFSCDDDFSVFLLRFSSRAKKALWHLGITRISELVNANLTFLEQTTFADIHNELHHVQKDFFDIGSNPRNILSDLLATEPLDRLGVSGDSLETLYQNGVKSLRDFLFSSVHQDNFELWQVQHEWRSRYSPNDFLRVIPLYFSIGFLLKKNSFKNTCLENYCDSFDTVNDFLSATFEDFVQLTDCDLSRVRELQSIQYEMVVFCHGLHPNFMMTGVIDERQPGWEWEIKEETLETLPFFDGKPNRGSSNSLHASFFPTIKLDKIVRGTMLQTLKKVGIFTLGELLFVPSSHLLLIRHCSKGKIAGVRKRIRKLLFPPPPPPLDKSTPQAFLVSFLQNYVRSERAIDILSQRINGKTLESIAEMYGLTRERVRQLENKCKSPAAPTIAWQSFAELRLILESSMLKLGGFAHVGEIAAQLAKDNNWPEHSCNQLFAEFLLDRAVDTFHRHKNGYYALLSYPCEKCGELVTGFSHLCSQKSAGMPTRHSLYSNLLETCCSKCVTLPQRLTESFIDWKCFSDPLYRQILGEENIYRSKKRSMQRMVYHILKDASRPLDAQEILSVVKSRAENEDFTERQIRGAGANLCSSKDDIFLWDRGSVFVHRKYIPTERPLFALIEERLKQLIKKAKTPYISLYTLFGEYKSECEMEGIPSAHALHACLKARGISGIAFMRSPCVSVTNEKHERRNVEILEDWVAQKQDIASTHSLKRYAREIGINSHRYASTFANAKSLMRFGAGLIVHLRSLEWNPEKEKSLLDTATTYWRHCISHDMLFARTDDLLSEYEDDIPELANGIPWTSGLLFSLLARSESILSFGNTYLAYGCKVGDFTIRTLGDIVAEVLKKQFGGGAKLSEISSYFRDDLRILRLRLTPGMVRNHPELVITEHEVYLSGGVNAS